MTTSARRQLFRRSKAGCWNCRSKKKKCDELRPHCTRCVRAGENCRYPDTSSESLPDANTPISSSDYVSPGLTASTSFPSSLSVHAAPMLWRSSSTSGYSSQHPSRHGQHQPYPHHSYASSSASNVPPAQHRDYLSQRQASFQHPSSPAPATSHHPYYPVSHSNAQSSLAQQQFPPPPLSASAAADWDHTSEQQVFKRTRYDDLSSSSSSTSSNLQYQDARARQSFDAHHRNLSNHSQTSSKGKSRDTLPSFSPHQAFSAPVPASTSLPNTSPNLSNRPANTSTANQASPAFASVRQGATRGDSAAPESRIAAPPAYSPTYPAQASAVPMGFDPQSTAPPSNVPPPLSSIEQPQQKLVFDYASTEPDPEELMVDLPSLSLSFVTQPTKGAKAYFNFLGSIARMNQGQAMAHALAAVIATQRACLSSKNSRRLQSTAGPGSHTDGKAGESRSFSPEQALLDNGQPAKHTRLSDASVNDKSAQLLELANRHHLAAIKALQTQHQPSRRRRFSIIETTASFGAEELPVGSNAATMMLLILACSSAGKSLMLPSYFNQCEQFLADAIEHISSHRLFPSVTGEPVSGTPEDPPILPPENLSSYGILLFLGTVVGLYECYLSQYTAVTNWDYNPARLRRLLPYNWNESDAAIFDQARGSVVETTYSVSMVTLELVIETLDTMRKFKRAEAAAYGNRKSSRSEAEDGVAALDSLALREELGLLIRDLEAGTFWKGTIRILSDAEQLLVLDSVAASSSSHASKEEEEAKPKQGSQLPPPSTGDDTAREAITKLFKSGSLFLPSESGEQKQVNRLRLANHLYRNALVVDLYVTVFNRPPDSLAVRELVSRSISLLDAVPDKLEHGLMWPAIVIGSYAQDTLERGKVCSFVERAQSTGNAGSAIASDVLKRVWAGDADSWRESISYFGSPFLS